MEVGYCKSRHSAGDGNTYEHESKSDISRASTVLHTNQFNHHKDTPPHHPSNNDNTSPT